MQTTMNDKGDKIRKRRLQVLLTIVFTGIGLIAVIWINRSAAEYYPQELLESNPRTPISPSEESNGVIAKFELKEAQLDHIPEWYGNHGFDVQQGSIAVHGFGPDGLSFTMLVTNQAWMLVVSKWKDW